jgi:hypothetical protein
MASNIRIVGMSGNSVDPIPNSKLYRYSFHLSPMPEYDWKLLYEQTVKGGVTDSTRRRSTIVDDTIIVEMNADDNKQQQLDLQKGLVAQVNLKYAAAQEKIAADLAARAQEKQDSENEIARLREEAKGLQF